MVRNKILFKADPPSMTFGWVCQLVKKKKTHVVNIYICNDRVIAEQSVNKFVPQIDGLVQD